MINNSPYKYNGKGGSGKPEHVHAVPMPDTFRGPFKIIKNNNIIINEKERENGMDEEEAGMKYADEVKKVLEDVEKSGKKIAGINNY